MCCVNVNVDSHNASKCSKPVLNFVYLYFRSDPYCIYFYSCTFANSVYVPMSSVFSGRLSTPSYFLATLSRGAEWGFLKPLHEAFYTLRPLCEKREITIIIITIKKSVEVFFTISFPRLRKACVTIALHVKYGCVYIRMLR